MTWKQICNHFNYPYSERDNSNRTQNFSLKLFLHYDDGWIDTFMKKSFLSKHLGFDLNKKCNGFFDRVIDKKFYHKGNWVCISLTKNRPNFETLNIVCSTTFHIFNTLINQKYIFPINLTLAEVPRLIGIRRPTETCQKKRICEALSISHLNFDEKGDRQFNSSRKTRAISEDGVVILYKSISLAVKSFNLSNTTTITSSIRYNKPIPFLGVKWWFEIF